MNSKKSEIKKQIKFNKTIKTNQVNPFGTDEAYNSCCYLVNNVYI